jgi:excisionase family DNA binding protein
MEPEPHLSLHEIAEQLDVSVSTVWRLVRSGDLPTVQAAPKPGLALRTRVLKSALKAFVSERTHVA